jgi:TPR repeat protein
VDECKPLERGHVNAQYELGVAYSKGSGVPTDPAAAAAWFRKAAGTYTRSLLSSTQVLSTG